MLGILWLSIIFISRDSLRIISFILVGVGESIHIWNTKIAIFFERKQSLIKQCENTVFDIGTDEK